MMKCNIKTVDANKQVANLSIGDGYHCISSENALALVKKFKDSNINVEIHDTVLSINVDYPEVIVDCDKDWKRSI